MMKKNLTRIALVFVFCALTGVVATAKEKSRLVSFGTDFVIGISFPGDSQNIVVNDSSTQVANVR